MKVAVHEGCPIIECYPLRMRIPIKITANRIIPQLPPKVICSPGIGTEQLILVSVFDLVIIGSRTGAEAGSSGTGAGAGSSGITS